MNKRNKNNTIRIISGKWRSRRIPVYNAQGLRPTTDRVRETVFNWLMQDVHASRCCDLFSGSGALGLECLSRGAEFVHFIDSNMQAIKQIQQNLQSLYQGDEAALTHSSIVECANTLKILTKPPLKPYDIVFLDPPFSMDVLEQCAQMLDQNAWIKEGSLIYVEHNTQLSSVPVPSCWTLSKHRKAGQAVYKLYQR